MSKSYLHFKVCVTSAGPDLTRVRGFALDREAFTRLAAYVACPVVLRFTREYLQAWMRIDQFSNTFQKSIQGFQEKVMAWQSIVPLATT